MPEHDSGASEVALAAEAELAVASRVRHGRHAEVGERHHRRVTVALRAA